MYVVDFQKEPVSVSRRQLSTLPSRVAQGDPHHVTQMQFESPDGSLISGTWESTPGKWHAFVDRDEFCILLSGHIELISEDGTVQTFKKGDSFLIPNGFVGFWNVIETTKKHFVIRLY